MTSWMLVSMVTLIIVRSLKIDVILSSVNPIVSLGSVVGAFFLLCLVLFKNEGIYTEKKLLFYTMILFFAVSLAISEKGNCDEFESTAMFTVEAIITALTAKYVFGNTIPHIDLGEKKCKVYIAVVATVVGLYIFITCAIKYLAFDCEVWDFGIFTQMFESMRSTLIPYVSCERNELMTHFSVHFSPVYYLLLPFYALVPSALTLLLLQAAGVVSGVIPVYLLCRRLKQGNLVTLALCLVYLIHPVIACGCSYDMHENFFLTPFLLWLFYFIEKDKTLPIVIFSILTCCVKEDATIYVLSVSLFLFFCKKKRILGTALFALACVWFVAATTWLIRSGDGTLTSEHYMNFGPSFFKGILTTAISYPSYILSQIVNDRDKTAYAVQILGPMAFLPLFNKKIPRYTLLIPFIIMNLITSYENQYSIFFYYNFGSFACLFYLYLTSVTDLKKELKRIICAFSVASCIILSVPTTPRATTDIPFYLVHSETIRIMWKTVKSIPDGASVAASEAFVPYLSSHGRLYFIHQTTELDTHSYGSDYIVLDLRKYTADGYNCYADEYRYYLANSRYELVSFNEGASAVFKLR